MDLSTVAVLIEAVHAGSLAEAARRLKITPMVASRRLAALEEEVGARLLHRTTRSISLSTEGEAFLPFAQAMIENEANALQSIRPSESGASGLLRVTASAAFGRKVVAPMIPAYLEQNPEARLDLMLTDGIVDVVGLGIDLAIRIAPLRDSALVARKIADNPRALYAAPQYLESRGQPKVMAELARHDCLALTGTTHWTFRSGGDTHKQRIEGRFTSSSIEGIHEACLGGLGIAMLSAWDVLEELHAGHLIEISFDDGVPDALAVWAVLPSARFVPPKARSFIAALERHLADR